jgi:hypothetical protein
MGEVNSYQYKDNVAMMGSDEAPVFTNTNASRKSGSKWIWTAGLAMVVVAVTLIARNNSSSSDLPPSALRTAALEGSSKASATACTFEECYESNCNWELAPFTCLIMNGGPHGGCSAAPWMVPETCTTQCDLSKCGDLKTPKDADSCDTACEPDFCQMAGERLCGSPAAYQCVEGSAAFGCSDDEFTWAFKSSVQTCSKCCNATKCA